MAARKLFRSRADAGQKLAVHLGAYRRASPIVLGLPRGGVPVAYEIARALEAPLDVCVVRKLGPPAQPELGLGAVSEDGTVFVDGAMARRLDVDEAALASLIEERRAARVGQTARYRAPIQRDVLIAVSDDRPLEGALTIPPEARGLVIFSHGSGSTWRGPQAQYVAAVLHQASLATLLFDLLTDDEELLDAQTAHLCEGVPLLTSRLVAATDWARQRAETSGLDVGYFGVSTGAAAALAAAAQRPDVVHALVSRGGRPDLVEDVLDEVQAPTLLLVGGLDADVLTINRESLYFLGCEKLLEIVPEATHLFEEPGALEHAAHAAARWFQRHLAAPAHDAGAAATA